MIVNVILWNVDLDLTGNIEMTQKEVAELLGISQSYISRLEKKIITDLRESIKSSDCLMVEIGGISFRIFRQTADRLYCTVIYRMRRKSEWYVQKLKYVV